jgi:hypothetical protein
MVLASRANGNMAELMERVKCGMRHLPIKKKRNMAELMERVKCGMRHLPIYTSHVGHMPLYMSHVGHMPIYMSHISHMFHMPVYITHTHTHTHTHIQILPHPHHTHTHRYGTYGTVTCPPVTKKERKKEQDTEASYPRPTRQIDTQFGIPGDGDRFLN